MAKLFSRSFRKNFLAWILPPLAFIFMKLLYATCKKKFYIEEPNPPSPSIYALWHGEILMLPFAYIQYAKNHPLDAMISRHLDGEVLAKVIRLFGGGTIRGSTSKGASSALRGALHSFADGHNIAITPDGPRGPRHTIADGLISLAMLKKVPIITLNCKPSTYWTMKSWDAFCIPKPFCTLEFYIGRPIFVHDMPMEEAKTIIRDRLLVHAI